MKVLIGYDGSESAAAAIDEIKKIGLPAETEILLGAAGNVWLPPSNTAAFQPEAMASRRVASTMAQIHSQTVQTFEEAEEILIAAADQILADFPNWRMHIEYLRGDAASEIIRRAAEWKADLILVGTQNRSAVGRFFLGSVSQKVVAEAGCSVRVVRGAGIADKNAPRRVVAGVDSSQSAHLIVKSLVRREWTKDSVVMLVTATEGFGTDAVNPVRPIIAAQKMQQSAKAMLNAAGLKVLTTIREGDAKSVLLAEAENLHADCIFVSPHNIRGVLERFFSGSVSTSVVADAPCSVEVVR